MTSNRQNVLRVGIAGKRGLSLVSGFRALANRAGVVPYRYPDQRPVLWDAPLPAP